MTGKEHSTIGRPTLRPLEALWHGLSIALLATLTITGCSPISHWPPAVSSVAEIEELPVTQRDLRTLGGDVELSLISSRFPALEYLFVSSHSTITATGWNEISKLRELNHLAISDGSTVSDQAITSFATIPALTKLMIDDAVNLTDASLDELCDRVELEMLRLRGCSNFSPEAKDRIRASLSSCQVTLE